ncbi:hypothetical protein [Burkholderia sp. BE17]|uniref:hypothetical protein n=1 Tax=Burkholderia sp. BE17 TaxID=2656644 RepID=UPI00128D189E|nr:hypothetical protein [Burkholderia sp. BE17]MPV67638.1 hypothetical protein [Burkholderia sp. BE17]
MTKPRKIKTFFAKIFGKKPPDLIQTQSENVAAKNENFQRCSVSADLNSQQDLIATLAVSIDGNVVAQCISHYSGYVREVAISRAVELGDDSLLDLIAERVNDWVPEVRQAAKDALLSLLTIVPATSFVSIVPRLRGLMLAKRADHRAWLLDFERRLVRAGGASAIVEAMTGPDFRLRRAAYLVAHDHQLLPVTEIVKRGLLSGDIMLARCAAELLDRVPVFDRDMCVAIAAMSPFGAVRFAAFKFVANDRVAPDTEPFLWRTVFDSQGSLRSAAAKLLADSGRDVVKHCRTVLEGGGINAKQVRAGLSLLAERGTPDATEVLARYVTDARTEVRAHALMLRARISPALKDEIASAALLDPSRKVRKVGVRLCTEGAFVSLDVVAGTLAQHGDHHAALMVCAREQWDTIACIALIIELATLCDQDYGDVREPLRKWIDDQTSSWTNPTDQHRQILFRPGVGLRMFDLAGAKQTALRVRMHEHGIEL